MFRAIGYVIIIYALATMLSDAFGAFERAIVATFETIEIAALVSQSQIEQMK